MSVVEEKPSEKYEVITPLTRSRTARIATSTIAPYFGLTVLIVALIVFNVFTDPVFYSWANIVNLLRSLAIPLTMAAGGTLVVLTGAVDLSAGSMLGFTGIVYAELVIGGVNPWAALVATIAVGAVTGFLVNGMLIGRVGMSFFVVTLGLAQLLRGLAYLWTGGTQIDMSSDQLAAVIGDTAILGGRIPVSFLIALFAVVAIWVTCRFTTYGRSLYAAGGNREAAELSGVRTAWVIAGVYLIAALFATVAGIMTIGRVTLADPNAGNGVELVVIAGIMLGGVALTGGVGSVWGAALGTVFLSILSNTLALHGFSNNWQLVATGVILIIAVLFDRWRQRMAEGR